MKLNDEQNILFMNDKRRLEAEKKLHDVVSKIQDSVEFKGNAGYYLKTLPPLVKQLEDASKILA